MLHFLNLRKLFYRSSRTNELLYKIKELEKRIEQIKLQIDDTQVIRIEKVIVEKIVCEKIETNYKIDSITTDNLSGTMNVGTIYPSSETKCAFDKDEVLEQSGKPQVNLNYK